MHIYEKELTIVAVDETTHEVLSATMLNPASEGKLVFELTDDELKFFVDELDFKLPSTNKNFCADVSTVNNIIRMCLCAEAEMVRTGKTFDEMRTVISISNKLAVATHPQPAA